MPREQINISFRPEQAELVRAAAKRAGLSLADFVYRAAGGEVKVSATVSRHSSPAEQPAARVESPGANSPLPTPPAARPFTGPYTKGMQSGREKK